LVWPVWRLVIARVATLTEIREHWSLIDVADANEVLDIKEELERREMDRIKRD
jgi:hypothetical protein